MLKDVVDTELIQEHLKRAMGISFALFHLHVEVRYLERVRGGYVFIVNADWRKM